MQNRNKRNPYKGAYVHGGCSIHIICNFAHPKKVFFHFNGKLAVAEPEHTDGRGGQLGDTSAHTSELAAQQLLLLYGCLEEEETHKKCHLDPNPTGFRPAHVKTVRI